MKKYCLIRADNLYLIRRCGTLVYPTLQLYLQTLIWPKLFADGQQLKLQFSKSLIKSEKAQQLVSFVKVNTIGHICMPLKTSGCQKYQFLCGGNAPLNGLLVKTFLSVLTHDGKCWHPDVFANSSCQAASWLLNLLHPKPTLFHHLD